MSFPRPATQKKNETDFEIGELLGRGNFTSVYHATERETGKRVALKIVDRYRCTRLKKIADVFMEKHCLARTNHPNIVKMHWHFTDSAGIYVAMEECDGGELWDLIKTVGCPDAIARNWFAQVINALSYLRDARIVHRDLKAENVMLNAQGVLKLIDFGTAKDLENPQIKGSGNASRSKVFEDYVGTPQFMPPEVIENKFTDFRSDTWSFGCLMFQILSGVPPFHAASEYLTFLRIQALDLQFPPGIHPQAQDLVRRTIVSDADSRLGALDIGDFERHPYFAEHGIRSEGSQLRPAPPMSLADACLRKIGQQLESSENKAAKAELRSQLEAWPGREELKEEVRTVLERMVLVQTWQDNATPQQD